MWGTAGRLQSLHTIIVEAKQAIDRFAKELRTDGQVLLAPLRSGTAHIGTIDAWLGRLADYMEMLDAGQPKVSRIVVSLCSYLDSRTVGSAHHRRRDSCRGFAGV